MAEQSNIGARRIRRSDIESLRCPHCAGPLCKDMETSEWTVPPLIRDSFSMIGSAVGGTARAFYGFNHAMPIIQRWIKGPMWLHFLIGEVDCYSGFTIAYEKLLFTNSSSSILSADNALSSVRFSIYPPRLAPPVIVFSSGCAGLAGGAVPALAQLASSSYHAAVSSSSSPPSSS